MTRAALFLAAGMALAPRHCGAGTSSNRVAGRASKPPQLSVLFASDVRGRTDLLPRRATIVDRTRLEVPDVIQVDAGDLFPLGAPEDVVRRGRLLMAAYGRMGVDAITIGERELALGPSELKSMATAAGVLVVAANIVDGSGTRVFAADRIIETRTWRVGVFGIVEPTPETSASWSQRWGLTTLDPIAGARSEVASLRAQGAKIIIGLFNVAGGAKRAAQLARLARGIDAIVVGDGAPDDPPMIQRPLVVHTIEGGSQIGRLDVRVRHGAPSIEPQLSPLTLDVPEQVGVTLMLRLDAAPVARAPTGKHFQHWTYASNEACGFCHKSELAQWQTTDHALAFASLRDSGHGAEPACLGCHMTGFLLPGGTEFIDTAVEQMSDVGCECCHGPSAAHVASVDKKKGTHRKVDPTLCLGCHTPDQGVEPFDVAAAMAKILGPGHGERKTP
jgi:hypothetical protein